MHVTGLEILVHTLRGTLLVVLLVVIVSATVTKLGVLVSTIALTMIVVVASRMQPVAPALVGEIAQLTCVLLLPLMTQLMLCFHTYLLDLMAL